MIIYFETNVCPIRALLTTHECVPEVQERCKRMKLVHVAFLLFCQGLTPCTHLCCLLHNLGSEQTFPQANLLLYTFVSKMVITNFYSTRKSKSKGYQKPLVNGFTLWWQFCRALQVFPVGACSGILFPICLFPVNLITICSIACALGCHQTYQGTFTRPKFPSSTNHKNIFFLLLPYLYVTSVHIPQCFTGFFLTLRK